MQAWHANDPLEDRESNLRAIMNKVEPSAVTKTHTAGRHGQIHWQAPGAFSDPSLIAQAQPRLTPRLQDLFAARFQSCPKLQLLPVAGNGRHQSSVNQESIMSEHFKNLRGDTPFGAASPEGRRELAVAAALTLIQAKVLNSASSGQLQTEMNNLNKYADQIQAALEVV